MQKLFRGRALREVPSNCDCIQCSESPTHVIITETTQLNEDRGKYEATAHYRPYFFCPYHARGEMARKTYEVIPIEEYYIVKAEADLRIGK